MPMGLGENGTVKSSFQLKIEYSRKYLCFFENPVSIIFESQERK